MYTGKRQGAQGHAHPDGAGVGGWTRPPRSRRPRAARRTRPGAPGAARVERRLGDARARRGARLGGRADVRRRPRADRRLAARRRRGRRADRGLARRGRSSSATLLLIHDLHPVPLEQRVQDALDSVRPYMESHGGNVELLSLEHGVARIHLRGSCSDCSASSVTLELAIKQALEEAAPDLEGLEVEGVAPQTAGGPGCRWSPAWLRRPPTGMELPMVMSAPAGRAARGSTSSRSASSPTARSRRSASPAATWSWPTSRARCSPTATVAPAAARRCTTGLLPPARSRARSCARSFFLPRAGRSMDDDQRPARAGAAAARAGPREGGAGAMSDGRPPAGRRRRRRPRRRAGGRRRGLRGLARVATPPSPLRAAPASRGCQPDDRARAISAASASPRTTAICCTCPSAGSCARARRAGRCARARATTARPATGRCGSRTSTSPTICGRASRSRSGWRSSWSRRSPRASSRCTRARPGATESELHFDSWSRMRRAQPGPRRARAGHRGADRRTACPIRPTYVIAPIDRCYALTGTIKAHWEGISGGSGGRGRGRAILRRAAREGDGGLSDRRRGMDSTPSSGAGASRPISSSPCSEPARSSTRPRRC